MAGGYASIEATAGEASAGSPSHYGFSPRSVMFIVARGRVATRRTSPPPRCRSAPNLFAGGDGGGPVGRKAGGRGPDAKRNKRQKPPSPPPWGDLLGGKPIERQFWVFGKKREQPEQRLRAQQYVRMRQLMSHYGIVGADYALPIGGVAPAEWFPWYELALAIARDLDPSLQIVDAAEPRKTAPRWRGGREGALLLGIVEFELERTVHQQRSIRWILERVRKRFPEFGKMPIDELVARYYDAKNHRENTKRSGDRTSAS
jgi:hypothetical protein